MKTAQSIYHEAQNRLESAAWDMAGGECSQAEDLMEDAHFVVDFIGDFISDECRTTTDVTCACVWKCALNDKRAADNWKRAAKLWMERYVTCVK